MRKISLVWKGFFQDIVLSEEAECRKVYSMCYLLYKKGWERRMYTHICLFLQKKCHKKNPQAYENEYLQRMEGDDAERTELAFQVSLLYMVPSFFFFSTFIYFWDRERQSMNGGGAEREGDTESETGSRL